MGPNNIFGPAPSIRWGSKAQAEEGYGSDTVIQVQNSIGIQPRTIQSLASPKSPRKKGEKWYRNNLGKMAKNQSLPARLLEKDSQGENDLTMYEHRERLTVW